MLAQKLSQISLSFAILFVIGIAGQVRATSPIINDSSDKPPISDKLEEAEGDEKGDGKAPLTAEQEAEEQKARELKAQEKKKRYQERFKKVADEICTAEVVNKLVADLVNPVINSAASGSVIDLDSASAIFVRRSSFDNKDDSFFSINVPYNRKKDTGSYEETASVGRKVTLATKVNGKILEMKFETSSTGNVNSKVCVLNHANGWAPSDAQVQLLSGCSRKQIDNHVSALLKEYQAVKKNPSASSKIQCNQEKFRCYIGNPEEKFIKIPIITSTGTGERFRVFKLELNVDQSCKIRSATMHDEDARRH